MKKSKMDREREGEKEKEIYREKERENTILFVFRGSKARRENCVHAEMRRACLKDGSQSRLAQKGRACLG